MTVVLQLAVATGLGAQSQPPRIVDGVVMHGEPKGPHPIAGVRVVLHRVGPDRAGPLDSVLTDARGRYHFRYVPSGSSEAVYFVSASYDGIAYFSTPLQNPNTHGDDAQIQVFDTSSGPVPIHILGHHVIVGSPDSHGQREAVEVFELGNDSSVTRVSGGRERPVWQVALPHGVTDAKVNPTGEIAPSAIAFDNGFVRLYAPISPGARQVSYAYQVPKSSLPLSVPIEQPTGVLEVLLEEPHATVAGGGLAEVAPTTSGGRSFRRFLAQNVPTPSAVEVDVPFTIGDARARFFVAIAAVCGAAMVGAIFFATRRRRIVARVPAASLHAPATDELLQAIAQLDARFEQENHATPDQRAQYDAERARLKASLAAALAEERQPA
ncbi:MAG TPA: carboxypeptidase-like regulatory domain-containing protein [Gemmatimonadaceae bacterium]|nr:carboxypeptidase-like regulatory domain-containing protein [Gemmatimonadaceae bacterium]